MPRLKGCESALRKANTLCLCQVKTLWFQFELFSCFFFFFCGALRNPLVWFLTNAFYSYLLKETVKETVQFNLHLHCFLILGENAVQMHTGISSEELCSGFIWSFVALWAAAAGILLCCPVMDGAFMTFLWTLKLILFGQHVWLYVVLLNFYNKLM